jgi:hypothetical protein
MCCGGRPGLEEATFVQASRRLTMLDAVRAREESCSGRAGSVVVSTTLSVDVGIKPSHSSWSCCALGSCSSHRRVRQPTQDSLVPLVVGNSTIRCCHRSQTGGDLLSPADQTVIEGHKLQMFSRVGGIGYPQFDTVGELSLGPRIWFERAVCHSDFLRV